MDQAGLELQPWSSINGLEAGAPYPEYIMEVLLAPDVWKPGIVNSLGCVGHPVILPTSNQNDNSARVKKPCTRLMHTSLLHCLSCTELVLNVI